MMRIAVALTGFAAVAGCGKADPAASSSPPPRPDESRAGVVKAAPLAGPTAPRDIPRPSGSTIPGWGEVTDPVGDCAFRERDGYVTLTIPPTLHDINPERDGRNAPRVLRPIEGDFRAVVRVRGDFLPNSASTSKISVPFHGAGLVLWQDDRNMLLLARDAWAAGGGRHLCYAPMFELFENARGVPLNLPIVPAAAFRGESTALYLERRAGVVRGAYSHDAVNWEGWRTAPTRFPAKAFIGVFANNTAAQEFNVTFDGFKILDE